MSKYKLSDLSIGRLDTCSDGIQRVIKRAIEITNHDFMVVCGGRGEEDQNKAYKEKKSKKKWPNGKHNKIPSMAVDVCPCKGKQLLWEDYQAWCYVIGAIMQAANELDIKVKWGGNWKTYRGDFPHFEGEG